jgi:hypothetical protein
MSSNPNLLLILLSNPWLNIRLHCNHLHHSLLLETNGEIEDQGAGLLIRNQQDDTP